MQKEPGKKTTDRISRTPAQWLHYYAGKKDQAQSQTHYVIGGAPYLRQPFIDQPGNVCRDCGVAHGKLHVPSCVVEHCPVCHGYVTSCHCDYAPGQGVEEIREHGHAFQAILQEKDKGIR